MTAMLERALTEMTPPDWAHCVAPIGDHFEELFAEEQALLRARTPRRRREFATGRRCVRQALQSLGASPAPILPGPDRAPIWPDGFRASLSHSMELCVAVAARARSARAIGLDVEWISSVDATLLETIARPDELGADRRERAPGHLAACLFSIKEAVFKAYNPHTGAFLEFSDIRVRLNFAGSAFLAELANPRLPSVFGERQIEGKFSMAGGFVIALACI